MFCLITLVSKSHFGPHLAVWSFTKFVNDEVPVLSRKVVKEDQNPETNGAVQVALAVSKSDKESLDVVVVTDLRPFRIVLFERVAADVALRCVLIILPHLGTHAFHWSIRPKLFHDRRLPLN